MKTGAVGFRYKSLLPESLTKVPFVAIPTIETALPHVSESAPYEMDFRIYIDIGKKKWLLLADALNNGAPKTMRAAILRMKEGLRALGDYGGTYGVMMAPFISETSAEICAEAGLGYMDLAGNMRLTFDRIYIERRVAENPFLEKRMLQSFYYPKALRVIRVLLSGSLRPWKVSDLAKTSGASLGQVSNVRRKLLDQELAVERPDGVEIVKPEKVLAEWRAQPQRGGGESVQFFTLDELNVFEQRLSEVARKNEILAALTGLAAAAKYAPMEHHIRTTAYVSDIKRIADKLKLKPVESGANVVLIQPSDDGVFHGSRQVDNIQVACPVQVYVDLASAGERSDEASEALLDQVIRREWWRLTENKL